MGLVAVILMLSFKPAFSLSSFTFIKRHFSSSSLCHKGGVLWISEVIDIPPCNLDSSFESSSLAFCMMYSAYKLNKQGDSIYPCLTPFPIWDQSYVPCLILTVASWLAYRFLRRQVRWSGIPISWRIFQFVVIHTVKGFSVVNETEVYIFLEFSCFSVPQQMLAIWSLVPLPFLNSPWTFGSSWFTYCWNLAWKMLSITC